MARRRRNLGFLALPETDRRLVVNAATSAVSAVVVQQGFDKIQTKLPAVIQNNKWALNGVKVLGAMAVLKTGVGRSDLGKSIAAGMVVSAVYDVAEDGVKQILNMGSYPSLRGYTPAPRLSTSVSEAGMLTNNLGAYSPVRADSINVASVV